MFSPNTCPVCWYDQEEALAIDEWRNGFPAELEDGLDDMLGACATVVRRAARADHGGAHGLSSGVAELAADAAEFIASWRCTNAGPTRPRVVAAMRELETSAR